MQLIQSQRDIIGSLSQAQQGCNFILLFPTGIDEQQFVIRNCPKPVEFHWRRSFLRFWPDRTIENLPCVLMPMATQHMYLVYLPRNLEISFHSVMRTASHKPAHFGWAERKIGG
jgi:hypothetical protein